MIGFELILQRCKWFGEPDVLNFIGGNMLGLVHTTLLNIGIDTNKLG